MPDWILRMSARIRETEGLRDQEGGRVEEKTFAVPLGVRLGDGRSLLLRGSELAVIFAYTDRG